MHAALVTMGVRSFVRLPSHRRALSCRVRAWCHPERSRFSGGEKDLAANGERAPGFGITPLERS